MNSFRILTAASVAAAALSIAAPSYANGPRAGHAGPPRAHAVAPRSGIGYRAFGPSHFAGYGFGFGYDPFGWPGYGFGGPGYYGAPASTIGGVRIKDAPRDAGVYVDDAYAGIVDSFDGRFQRLTLEPGSYRIDVRGAGVSESVNVNVQPGRTTTVRMPRS